MTDMQWPTEAREAAARAIADVWNNDHDWSCYTDEADAVLAALAPHVQPRQDEQWEWGVKYDDGQIDTGYDDLDEAQSYSGDTAWGHAVPVRRHPATDWEDAE